MRKSTRTACAALAALGVGMAATPVSAGAAPVSEAAAAVANWVIGSGDNHGLPFAIVDKVAAEVAVYGADGELLGAGPALVGLAVGDDSTPGIGDRELSAIGPEERTTPAGRFLAAYGPAIGGRKVLWVDYATAISLHPVVTAKPKEQRLKRLLSSSPQDNRITYGCINVSAGFYQRVVRKAFLRTSGVIYVLPETRPLGEVFPALADPAWGPEAPEPDLAAAEAVAILGADSAGADAGSH